MKWERIHPKNLPMRGTTVLVFTPSNAAMRYRLCDSELLRTLSEATHWAYPQPPDDFWDFPEAPI